MKFYIASGLSNKELVRYVSEKLIEKGYIHTYDWTQNNRATDEETLREIGELEKKAVAESDMLIVLLPGGKGTHTELGLALALNKPVYLYSSEELDISTTTTFYFVEGVDRFHGEVDDFIQHIIISSIKRKGETI
ncbi:nucleoside 2-deoxyribosyltransferase [Ornithinibacillus salinisoli]|uniref:Nucleoside 2-deoxyribosyltransferase n=1 Tax=Ornithinibacillus salinisoli TaxID=1848459 RepID=A0ABW4W498_9BACI